MVTEYLSLEALAVSLNLPKHYLKGLAQSGVIPCLDVNGRLRFSEPDVRDALSTLASKRRGHDEQ